MNARMPLASQVGNTMAARPSDVGPAAPRFLVGAKVSSLIGVAGVVVEVYGDERRVKKADGSLAWCLADHLVAVREAPRRKRAPWRGGC